MGDQYCLDFWFSLKSLANSIYISRFAPLIAKKNYLSPKLLGNGGKALPKDTVRY